MQSYLDRLAEYYGVEPDSRQWIHVPCPQCNAAPATGYGDTHFSFSSKGGHCFVCHYTCSLKELVDLTDAPEVEEGTHRVRKITNTKGWLDFSANKKLLYHLISDWNTRSGGYNMWSAYKKGIPPSVYDFYKMGIGELPDKASRCNHTRLIIPLIGGGDIFGLRARHISCDCPKWLGISGNKKFLFNGGSLVNSTEEERKGSLGKSLFKITNEDTLYIVENPIDSILLYEKFGKKSVATLGITMWEDKWYDIIAEASPKKVIVLFDNDLMGAPNPETYKQQCIVRSQKTGVFLEPTPLAFTRVKELKDRGVAASVYRWPDGSPHKMDVGMLL